MIFLMRRVVFYCVAFRDLWYIWAFFDWKTRKLYFLCSGAIKQSWWRENVYCGSVSAVRQQHHSKTETEKEYTICAVKTTQNSRYCSFKYEIVTNSKAAHIDHCILRYTPIDHNIKTTSLICCVPLVPLKQLWFLMKAGSLRMFWLGAWQQWLSPKISLADILQRLIWIRDY